MSTWRRPGISNDDGAKPLRVGTRGSALARAQTEKVMESLVERFPSVRVAMEIIKTTGDLRTDVPLHEIGGKGLFVKELDVALVRGEVSLAVHSLKDLPAELAVGVVLAAVPRREDPRDAWIHREGLSIADTPPGSKVGTSSLRRVAELKLARPDLEIVPLRGNVDTRLRKVREGQGMDAIILATAGLNRLGLSDVITERLDPDVFLPAVGQGCVAVTIRERDANTRSLVHGLNHPDSRVAAEAERAFLAVVEGDCRIPVAAHAVVDGGQVRITGLLATPDGKKVARRTKEGFASVCDQVGRELGQELLDDGGREILEEVRAGV